jgi:carboxylesterase type B
MAPPVGDLRWAAPQPKAPWSPAVLDASQYSAGCPQDCGLPPSKCETFCVRSIQMTRRQISLKHNL